MYKTFFTFSFWWFVRLIVTGSRACCEMLTVTSFSINPSCTQWYYNRRFDSKEPSLSSFESLQKAFFRLVWVKILISWCARGPVTIGLVYYFLIDCDCTKPLNVVWLSVPFSWWFVRHSCIHFFFYLACVLLFFRYIDGIWPGEYGVPKPLYFPFLPSYWTGRSRVSKNMVRFGFCHRWKLLLMFQTMTSICKSGSSAVGHGI